MVKEDTEPSETDSDYLHFLNQDSGSEALMDIKLEPEEKLDSQAAMEKERLKKDNHNKSKF